MNAPDKIYAMIVAGTLYADTKQHEVFNKPYAEYVRKDALLEWAKQKQYESLTIVADNFWQEVIDKFNEL